MNLNCDAGSNQAIVETKNTELLKAIRRNFESFWYDDDETPQNMVRVENAMKNLGQ